MKLSGHTEMIDLIGVPDGPLLMSYSNMEEENLMRIWDVNTWECLATYRPEDVVSELGSYPPFGKKDNKNLNTENSCIVLTYEELHWRLFL